MTINPWKIIVTAGILIGGFISTLYSHFKSEKIYTNLKHCKLENEWVILRDDCWNRASDILKTHGYESKTKCREIVIEAGIKINPKTNQWGRSCQMNGEEFWYAGLCSGTKIQIVADPDKKPYNRSAAIMSHEIAESILTANGCTKTIDERNTFLWSIGL